MISAKRPGPVPGLMYVTSGPRPTDAENDGLVERAAGGDRAARDEAIVRNLPLALAVAKDFYRKLGPGYELADIASEAAVGLVDGVDCLAARRDRRPGAFGPFVTVVVKRRLLRYASTRRARHGTQCEEGEAESLAAPGGDGGFESRDEARFAMGTLAAAETRLVRLRFGFDGEAMSLAKAVRVVGCDEKNARRLERAALGRMRRRLGVAA